MKNKTRMTIEIENIDEAQKIAIEDLLATWVHLGKLGGSRWTSFYSDGDGNFRPKIFIDGKEAEHTRLISNDLKWPNEVAMFMNDGYQIDFDWLYQPLREKQKEIIA